ncbi:MAG: acetoin:2,6-dichlorophenolindophenol oxidoreductase subunit beta [bacterium]|nr:acetoin:2,6-dichlorophenolindophenol oxidoreductase subunit beta [bacterium]
MPSTPYDAKGLLKASIRDDNPVIFLEHKMLYGVKGPVPEEDYIVPLGVADVKREGKDLTIIATSLMVHKALEAASLLEKEGVSVEVIDPRTLYPLDEETILSSVKKTHKALVVHEAVERNGFGGEIVSIIMEKAFEYLDAPVKRVCGKNVPIPFSPPLERFVIPQVEDIVNAAKTILK